MESCWPNSTFSADGKADIDGFESPEGRQDENPEGGHPFYDKLAAPAQCHLSVDVSPISWSEIDIQEKGALGPS